jgi:lysozyme family protein
MTDRFDVCLPYILKYEGGNDDDPHDPGGRTSRGVIQREYNAYRRRKGEPTHDVWEATDAEIADIYRHQYWDPWCPQLPAGVDLCFFDMAVNSGPSRATILLQRALGVKDDGHIGLITLQAIADADPVELITAYASKRLAFYRSLHTFRYFGKGWTERTIDCKKACLKMAVTE